MPRRQRLDEPGAWHHVYNRGVAKRALFLSRRDHRYFLSCLAHATRAGNLEVHQHTLVLNHFHALVRSPEGRLDAAMHGVQMGYARYLNRRLRRVGPLFCERYKSRRILSHAYHMSLVAYIDANPVAAGLATRPEDHPWSSAACYAAKRRPPWLTTSWIDAQVRQRTGRDAGDTDAYRRTFPLRVDPGFRAWVERRFRMSQGARDNLDIALGPDPRQTLAWMRRQALLADGEESALPVADAGTIMAALRDAAAHTAALGGVALERGPVLQASDLLAPGLLRDAAGLTWDEVALRVGRARETARNRWLAHRRRLLRDPAYAEHAASIVRAAARATVG